MVLATVGIVGKLCTALIATVEAAEVIHVLSTVLRTVKVNVVLGANPEKVVPFWYAPPVLNSTPACGVKLIVPVGIAQVG